MFFKVRLLNDESTKWLFQRRIKIHLNNTTERIKIEEELINMKNISKKAAHENLGIILKNRNRRRYLKCWDEDINKLVQNKQLLYTKWLNT
jgi:hypothetical protein